MHKEYLRPCNFLQIYELNMNDVKEYMGLCCPTPDTRQRDNDFFASHLYLSECRENKDNLSIGAKQFIDREEEERKS